MKKAIERFNQNYSDYERGLFLEAFIDNVRLIIQKKVDAGIFLFIIKVSKKYPFCVILEISEEEALYFQTFNDLEGAEGLFNYIKSLYVN